MNVIPGSLLSQLCAFASPETFVWSRLTDACLSMNDPQAALTHCKIERWALDEFPRPGKLVHEILEWLFREDRFCGGTLSIGINTVGPSSVRVPTLVVISAADEIAPTASVRPFIDAMPQGNVCLIEHASEMGVGLQHLAILVGQHGMRRSGRRLPPGCTSTLEFSPGMTQSPRCPAAIAVTPWALPSR